MRLKGQLGGSSCRAFSVLARTRGLIRSVQSRWTAQHRKKLAPICILGIVIFYSQFCIICSLSQMYSHYFHVLASICQQLFTFLGHETKETNSILFICMMKIEKLVSDTRIQSQVCSKIWSVVFFFPLLWGFFFFWFFRNTVLEEEFWGAWRGIQIFE